jgi:hypothetical protein
VADGAGRLSQPRDEQGDTDLTDLTDSTDRSSVGSAPCPTSPDDVFDDGTPIAFGSPSSASSIPRSLNKIRPGSWGVEASASESDRWNSFDPWNP